MNTDNDKKNQAGLDPNNAEDIKEQDKDPLKNEVNKAETEKKTQTDEGSSEEARKDEKRRQEIEEEKGKIWLQLKDQKEEKEKFLVNELAASRVKGRYHFSQLQRAVADFQNLRKKTAKEKREWVSYSTGELIYKLIGVLDDFKRAFENINEDELDEKWISGFLMIKDKFKSILEAEGLKEMGVAKGDNFDPRLHEAIQRLNSDNLEVGKVIAVVLDGYKLNEKVIRPAQVVVSSGQK